MKLKEKALISDQDTQTELFNMFVDHFEYSIEDIHKYEDFTPAEQRMIPRWLFDKIAEKTEDEIRKEKIANRFESNLTILALLEDLIREHPDLRFQQLLESYKLIEIGKDKFHEESVDTLAKLREVLKIKI